MHMFQAADEDRNGVVDRREFKAMLGHLGLPLSTRDAQLLISALDVNGDGVVDYREFMEFIVQPSAGADSDPHARRSENPMSQSAPEAIKEAMLDREEKQTVSLRQVTAKILLAAMNKW
jgi:hypothetical protein